MVDEVLNPGHTPRLQNYLKSEAQYPYMPIEFSGAAFRFGHSMVRPSYSLNTTGIAARDADPAKERVPTFSRKDKEAQNLNGFPGRLPEQWGIDFGFFLDLPAGNAAGQDFKLPQPSYRIDALLVSPLSDLPEFFKQRIEGKGGYRGEEEYAGWRSGVPQLVARPEPQPAVRPDRVEAARYRAAIRRYPVECGVPQTPGGPTAGGAC